ncbi:hypothetical protein [Desulfatitalea tepidiphila]|uniref:hypothetical protein n=1 Tax=Desulfatitalea tepidiphila TaxID=1185843 RepID=UPI00128EBEF8|nr:hypothetical protein [Desulfatitalea tepidiphila]
MRPVQRRRPEHPGYWRGKSQYGRLALQDSLIGQAVEIRVDKIDFAQSALQDLFTVQPSVIIGIIAQLTGCAVQDDFVMACAVCNNLATISFIPQTKEVAMTVKSPICPECIRKIPRQFSWLDQRLVGEHYIDRCTHGAGTLYLFLDTDADARGLSFYADQTLCRRMAMDEFALVRYRQQLIDLGADRLSQACLPGALPSRPMHCGKTAPCRVSNRSSTASGRGSNDRLRHVLQDDAHEPRGIERLKDRRCPSCRCSQGAKMAPPQKICPQNRFAA